MTIDDLCRILQPIKNANDRLLISVAFHIAAEHANDPQHIKDYGTRCCLKLQQLNANIVKDNAAI